MSLELSQKKKKLKIALVYDRINKWGGAERILMLLHEMFPGAPVYTSVYDPVAAPWAKKLDVKTSFLEKIPYARRHHEFFALLMPVAFESFDFDEFDVVISLTSEAAKGIVTKPHTKHICICLTPTRYLWSEFNSYFPDTLQRVIFSPLIYYLRTWDKVAAARPDVMLSISKTVQDRVKKFYNRETQVAYPPLFLQNKNTQTKDEGYFLVVSRLSRFTPHKKVELAIKAANKLKLKLKVVGTGDITYFKNMAGSTVEIVGAVTDQELERFYAGCTALIFPGIEDFGLVMVEAQSYGKPVIAYRGGGATEIIREGKTGVFFEKPNVSSLVNTLKSFDKTIYNDKRCRENAGRFSMQNFKKKVMEAVQETRKRE